MSIPLDAPVPLDAPLTLDGLVPGEVFDPVADIHPTTHILYESLGGGLTQ